MARPKRKTSKKMIKRTKSKKQNLKRTDINFNKNKIQILLNSILQFFSFVSYIWNLKSFQRLLSIFKLIFVYLYNKVKVFLTCKKVRFYLRLLRIKLTIKLKQKIQLFYKNKPQYKEYWTPRFELLVSIIIILVVYGPAINYVFWYFWDFPFNRASILAFGIFAYFIKYELLDLLLQLRGPRTGPKIISSQ